MTTKSLDSKSDAGTGQADTEQPRSSEADRAESTAETTAETPPPTPRAEHKLNRRLRINLGENGFPDELKPPKKQPKGNE